MRLNFNQKKKASKLVDMTAAEKDKAHSRKVEGETDLQISLKAIKTFETACELVCHFYNVNGLTDFEPKLNVNGQKCTERLKKIDESLPLLSSSHIKFPDAEEWNDHQKEHMRSHEDDGLGEQRVQGDTSPVEENYSPGFHQHPQRVVYQRNDG